MVDGGYEVEEDHLVAAASRFRALAEEVPSGQEHVSEYVHLKDVDKGVIFRQTEDLITSIALEMDSALAHLGALSEASADALDATLTLYRSAEEGAALSFQIVTPAIPQPGD